MTRRHFGRGRWSALFGEGTNRRDDLFLLLELRTRWQLQCQVHLTSDVRLNGQPRITVDGASAEAVSASQRHLLGRPRVLDRIADMLNASRHDLTKEFQRRVAFVDLAK